MLVYIVSTRFYSKSCDPFGVLNILSWTLAMAAWVHSVHFVWIVGAQDFCRVNSPGPLAPYAVGVRHTRMGAKQLEATVFYPMDKAAVEGKPYTAKWYNDSKRMMKAYKRVMT